MDSNPQVEQLLAQGIQAARAGDKPQAREYLEQVVEQDQHNEKAWFWLAAVVDTDEEKRVCLGNVIIINPNNTRAQRLLDQLERGGKIDPNAPGGIVTSSAPNRSTVYVAIGLGATAVIVLVALLILILSGGGDDKNTEPLPVDTNNTTSTSSGIVAQSGTESPPLIVGSPTPSQTPSPPPPTWTPVPSPTPADAGPATPLATVAANLPGRIIMRSGQVIADENNQPIAIINPNGTNQITVSLENERGHAPVFSPDSSQYAFIKYAPGTREVVLQLNNLQGTAPLTLSARWGGGPFLDRQNAPAWSADGKWIVFTAMGMASATEDLYLVSMEGPDGNPDALTRLTTDDAIESWPAFSPDSQFIVYAADLTHVELNGSTELRIYGLVDGQISNLTSNGPELIESAPDWSPDGSTIVFQAQAAGASDTDIYTIDSSGLTEPQKLITSDANEIQPRYSPDGRYIVFSSDRTGNWDVFVYELESGTTYQVTTSAFTDIANDWGR